MRFLRQSTSIDLPIGPFLSSSDGFSPQTGLTITQPDILLKKGSANWAQKAAAQTLAHESTGMYECTLDATDTNTLGPLRLVVAESGALPVWEEFMVIHATVYDAWFSTGITSVNLTQWLGAAPNALVSNRVDASVGAMAANVLTATAINADAITAAKIADGALDANTFVAGSLNGKGDWNIGKTGYALSTAGIQALWDALTSALTTASSIGKLLVDNINATISSRSTQTSVDAIDTFLNTEVVTVDEMAEALVGPQATVVANGSNTATTFQVTITTVTEAAADWWKDAWFSFDLTAALAGQTKKVANFNQSTGMITMASAFTNVPTAGNTARLVTR